MPSLVSYQLQGLGTLWGGYVTQGEAEQLCIMPPCSGKTAVAFALVDKCTSRGAMTLFVVNSREELEHLVATHEEHDVLCEVPYLVLSGEADVTAMLSRGGDARVFYATRQLLTQIHGRLRWSRGRLPGGGWCPQRSDGHGRGLVEGAQ